MTTKSGNEPAYPWVRINQHDQLVAPSMTIRQHAAIAAMQGMLASESREHNYTIKGLSQLALEQVDALLKLEEETRE